MREECYELGGRRIGKQKRKEHKLGNEGKRKRRQDRKGQMKERKGRGGGRGDKSTGMQIKMDMKWKTEETGPGREGWMKMKEEEGENKK